MTDLDIPKIMPPEERYNWLLDYIRASREPAVSVLNADFVDAYVVATRARFRHTNWGAHKCPTLGRDLAELADRNLLKRFRVGLSSPAWQPGFPKWVWCYEAHRAPGKETP